ncbi:sensor histidine kinase [Streptomyces kasugaensis]|uniref:histidine kinase n=1 Tax=Streptomyces kasugaensis TaxID=1946 RepID=A0A4Q9HP47_STRKA|nr:sensor histidine kinase [Streptomyces kasugaensis]TBO56642.1 sensor histidine kinase [Streptomyces kasugaensis]
MSTPLFTASRRLLRPPFRELLRQIFRRFPPSAGYVLVCLGTGLAGLLALYALAIVFALCLVGTGFLLLPTALRALRRFAEFHRRQVSRQLRVGVATHYRLPDEGAPPGAPPSLRDPAVRKDLVWLLAHSVPGTLTCVAALSACGRAVNWLSAPVWWRLVPRERGSVIMITVDSWPKAIGAMAVGVGYAVAAAAVLSLLARLHALGSRRLLTARARVPLAQRVKHLSVTRAEALDAHDAELRRIERDLHDGAQAGIVAVSLRLGLIRRALKNRPEQVPEMVEATQQLTQQALDSLRQLVRGIYPPVLIDRGLVDAVRALAALSAVPTRIDIDERAAPLRAPAAVEAAAYFVISETMTNIAKHSGADSALVWLRITERGISLRVEDNGRGGASEHAGSGIMGVRRRVAAFDGSTELTSPPGGPTVLRVEIPCGS